MRVILVEPTGHQGHAAYTNSLARALRQRYDVRVVTRLREGATWCVPAVRVQAGGQLSLYPKILGALLRSTRDGDVVHFQSVSAPMVPVALALRLLKPGVRLANTVHNVDPHDKSMRRRIDCWLQRALVKLDVFSRVFVLRETAYAYGRGLTQALRTKIEVVPHQSFIGQKASRRCVESRHRSADPKFPLKVLFFGVIRPDKGLVEFLDAAKFAGGLDIDLRVIGTFAGVAVTDIRANAAAVTRLTVEPGFADDNCKSDAFRWCDFCLLPHLPSFKVGSGTLVDACERAAPVICVSGSSVAAAVEMASCGVVLPRGQAEAWSAILRTAATPSVYKRFVDSMEASIESGWGDDAVVASEYNYGQ